MGKSGQNCMQCASNDRTTYINKNGTLKLHYPTSDKYDYKSHGAHHSEKYDVFPVSKSIDGNRKAGNGNRYTNI